MRSRGGKASQSVNERAGGQLDPAAWAGLAEALKIW